MTALLLLFAAPLPFPKSGDAAPAGAFPVGRWEITSAADGMPRHFTIQLSAGGSGWVRHAADRKPLRWAAWGHPDAPWVDVVNDRDPSIPEAWDMGRRWGFRAVKGKDTYAGTIAGNPMTMRRLP
jgi:hypothetical protein